MTAFLSIASMSLLASLALVGVAIGVFYRRKFGEATRGWLLSMGAGLGFVGQILSSQASLPPMLGDLVSLSGAIFLGAGTFWLWFVMMGPRQ
jgi:hypothetical protein